MAKKWAQPKRPSVGELIYKMWYMQTWNIIEQ